MSCKLRGDAQCGGQLGARLLRGERSGVAARCRGDRAGADAGDVLAGVWVRRGCGTEGW
jgi:hypothetical protein